VRTSIAYVHRTSDFVGEFFLFCFFQIHCVLCQHPHLSNVWFLIQAVGFEVKKTTPAHAVNQLIVNFD